MSTTTGTPLVSIVTPTFKRPGMLREALESAVGQTLRDIEILVCDNADDPETRAVVESFADHRITYIGRPTNLGMVANALDGFRRARGEFVVKLDDDDVLEHDALERLVARCQGRPEVTAAFGDMRLVDAAGEVMEADTDQLRRDTRREGLRAGYHAPFTDLSVQGAVCLAATLLRRSAIDWDTVPEWAGTSYDLYLTLEAAADGAVGYYDDEPVVRYRIHSANDSVKNIIPNLEASQRVLRHARDSGRHTSGHVFDERLSQDHSRLAREYLLTGDQASSRRHALTAMRSRPSLRTAKSLVMASLPGGVGRTVAAARRQAYLASQTQDTVTAQTTPAT